MTCHFVFEFTWIQSTTTLPQIQISANAGTVVLDRARMITHQSDTIVVERGLALGTNQNLLSTGSANGVFLSRVVGWATNSSGASATLGIKFRSTVSTSTFTISNGTLTVMRDNGQTSF